MIELYAVDLLPTASQRAVGTAMSLELTQARQAFTVLSTPMAETKRSLPIMIGFIAGSGNGIVTVNGTPAQREILVMDAQVQDFRFIQRVHSLKNGHYWISELDPDKTYLVMCRDHEKQYEPCVYDYVQPATDLTLAEQQQLWESWQNEP